MAQVASQITQSEDELVSVGDGDGIEAETLQKIKKRSVSGAVSYFIRTGFINVIGFISAAILGVYLSPEDFGVYGIVLQIIGLLTFVSDVGLAAALIQKKETPKLADYRTAFTLQQILSWVIVIAATAIGLSPLFKEKAGDAGFWILVATALSFPLATIKTVSSVMLERKLNFSKLVLPQIVEQIVFQVTLLYLVLNGKGVLSFAYAIIIRSIVGTVVMMYLQPWKIGFAWDKPALKSLLGFGAKFQVNDLLARVKDQLFYLVLGLTLSNKEFGYINWAKQWSMYPYSLTVQNVMAITFPTFSRLQGHTQLLKKAIEKSLFFITIILFPMLAGMIVLSGPLVLVLPVYAKWQPAILSLILFTASIGWSAISTPLTNALTAIGKINTTLWLMVMWIILTWIVTPICIWVFGFNGVAVAAFCISFTSFVPLYFVNKVVPLAFGEALWRQTVAAIVMCIVGWVGIPIWQKSILHFMLGGVVMVVVYVIAVLIVGRAKLVQEIRSLR